MLTSVIADGRSSPHDRWRNVSRWTATSFGSFEYFVVTRLQTRSVLFPSRFVRIPRESFKGAGLSSNARPSRAPAPLEIPRESFKGAGSISKARTFRGAPQRTACGCSGFRVLGFPNSFVAQTFSDLPVFRLLIVCGVASESNLSAQQFYASRHRPW
jgi:hypothetical protein